MNIRIKAGIYLPLLILLIVGVLTACSGPSPTITPPLPDDSTTSAVDLSSDNKTHNLPRETTTPGDQLIPPDRIDVVYFHSTQRCKTCLYIEQRVVYITETYFQEELDSGKMTLQRLDLGDKENAAMISKYNAVSSQLYLNAIVNEIDHIIHIKEVWFKDYLRDEKLFDEVVKEYIKRGLNGEL